MATAIEFQAHETFHKAFLRMALAGAGAALACHLLATMIAEATWVSAPWRLGVVAVAVIVAGIWPRFSRGAKSTRAVLSVMLVAGAALTAMGAGADPAALTAACAFGAFVAVWGLRGRALAVAVLVTAPILAIAGAVFARLGSAEIMMGVPSAVPAVFAGVGFAAVAILSQLPRHILVVRDLVGASHRKIAPRAQGEVKELCDRGLDVWRKAESTLGPRDAHRGLLEEAVLRLYEVAGRWIDVEVESAHAAPETLAKRIADLEVRMDAASDEVVRGQYQAARDALREQLRYVDDIAANRERVLARMHNYLAAIERLNLALVNVKSTSASSVAVDVQPMVESLADLGRDIDSLGETLES